MSEFIDEERQKVRNICGTMIFESNDSTKYHLSP